MQLDDHHYRVSAPMCIYTPPATPHAFVTEDDACGYVLTVRQETVWKLLKDTDAAYAKARCMVLKHSDPRASHFLRLCELFQHEFEDESFYHHQTQYDWVRLILINLLGMATGKTFTQGKRSNDSKLFNGFNKLIEQHYTEHRSVAFYASELCVSTTHLNTVCQKYSDKACKQIIHEP